MSVPTETRRSPRVLIVMADQWPRALLRAALREAGYDAIGARSLREALRHPVEAPGRGPVRLILLDQPVLSRVEDPLLAELAGRHAESALVLIAPAIRPAFEGPWRQVVRRPASVAEILAAVRSVLPLAPGRSGPLD